MGLTKVLEGVEVTNRIDQGVTGSNRGISRSTGVFKGPTKI